MNSSVLAVLLYALLTALAPHSANATDFGNLTIMTEDFPPYNYSENGQAVGKSVELLLKASKAAGVPITRDKINVITWARGYKMTQEGPNAMLFSMTRTEAREELFKWAGPIAQNRIVVWAKKSSGIGKIDDISKSPEKIGVVRDTVGDQLVVAAGAVESNIVRNSKPDNMAKMLANNRVKLWAYSETSAAQTLRGIGENPNDYEVVSVLKSKDLYFAFSKDVDDKLIKLLQKGIDMAK